MSEALSVFAIIGGVFLLLAAIFIAIGTIRTRMTRGWMTTTGQVINRRGDPLASSLPASNPTFRWRDASGAEHRRTSTVNASFGPRPGKLVPVKYDPQNPSRAVIDSFVQSGQIFTVIGISLAVAGVLGASYAVWIFSSL
ncbi:MAG: hypothetical protein QOE58_2229 [Actinomycetota bacterium]|jgi:hypothetical protein|nr:hypothetical protein [Actinomycetota bacterium]